MKRLSFILMLVCGVAWPACGELHNQPLDFAVDGLVSDTTYGPMLAEFVLLGCDTPYPIVDWAQFLANGVITGVAWYGYYEQGAFAPTVGDTVDFSVAFLWNYLDDDPGGFLVNEVTAATVSASINAGDRTIYGFVADPLPAVSIPEVFSVHFDYAVWLAIAECDPDSDIVDDRWLWSRSRDNANPLAEAHDLTDPYIPYWRSNYRGEMAFTLTGVVPIPGAAPLGVIGLGCAGWRLRRRAV